jgi:hypothetical protein
LLTHDFSNWAILRLLISQLQACGDLLFREFEIPYRDLLFFQGMLFSLQEIRNVSGATSFFQGKMVFFKGI